MVHCARNIEDQGPCVPAFFTGIFLIVISNAMVNVMAFAQRTTQHRGHYMKCS